MKEILKQNANYIVLASAFVFAVLVWSYAAQGYEGDSIGIVIAGLLLVVLDALVLWALMTSKVVKKKKVTTKKKAKK